MRFINHGVIAVCVGAFAATVSVGDFGLSLFERAEARPGAAGTAAPGAARPVLPAVTGSAATTSKASIAQSFQGIASAATANQTLLMGLGAPLISDARKQEELAEIMVRMNDSGADMQSNAAWTAANSYHTAMLSVVQNPERLPEGVTTAEALDLLVLKIESLDAFNSLRGEKGDARFVYNRPGQQTVGWGPNVEPLDHAESQAMAELAFGTWFSRVVHGAESGNAEAIRNLANIKRNFVEAYRSHKSLAAASANALSDRPQLVENSSACGARL